jgi:hypothetical protein
MVVDGMATSGHIFLQSPFMWDCNLNISIIVGDPFNAKMNAEIFQNKLEFAIICALNQLGHDTLPPVG